MKIQEKHKTALFGIGLYAHQASQSLARAIPGGHLEDLRKFYFGRQNSRELAEELLEFQPFLQEINGGFFRHHLSRKSIQQIDLWMMSRLLYDFSALLDGANPAGRDQGNLRFCLALASTKFAQISEEKMKRTFVQINYFNRSEYLPEPLEIEDVIGNDWQSSLLIC